MKTRGGCPYGTHVAPADLEPVQCCSEDLAICYLYCVTPLISACQRAENWRFADGVKNEEAQSGTMEMFLEYAGLVK